MTREINQPERLLTIKEVAKIQQTCERTVRRRIASGELPAIRDGRLIRVRARICAHISSSAYRPVNRMRSLSGRDTRSQYLSKR